MRATIKHTDILSFDANKFIAFNRDQHKTFVKEHELSTNVCCLKRDNRHVKKDKITGIFDRKNAEHNYMGKFRFIFIQWRAHTARQKQFLTAINRTILKSMWQNGFDNISAFSRDKHQTRVQNKHLQAMVRMYKKKRAKRALNQWRYSIWANCVDGTVVLARTYDEEVKYHKTRSERIKEWTQKKGLKYVRSKNLTMLFNAWKNAILEQKALRNAT